ncbi:MAG: hypothetical protein KH276_10910 [Prevotella histicola]|nr:hypothetical protein [Prevotella histicola]
MYVTPVVELVSLAAERQLLAGSGVTVSNQDLQNMGSQTIGGGGTTTTPSPSNPYSSSAGQQSGSQSAGAKFSGGITWFGE